MSAGPWGSPRRALGIVLLGIGAGLAGNWVSPRGLSLVAPPVRTDRAVDVVTLGEARRLWQGGAVLFIDARDPADFAAGHVGNALNLPAQDFARRFGGIAPMLTPASEMVLYCDGMECELSHRLAESLRQRGQTNLHILLNGWTAWHQAGLPTAEGGTP